MENVVLNIFKNFYILGKIFQMWNLFITSSLLGCFPDIGRELSRWGDSLSIKLSLGAFWWHKREVTSKFLGTELGERMVGSDWETMMTLWRTLIKNFFALNLLHF